MPDIHLKRRLRKTAFSQGDALVDLEICARHFGPSR